MSELQTPSPFAQNSHKTLALLALVAGVFILLFFTLNQYKKTQSLLSQRETAQSEEQEFVKKLENLNKLNTELSNPNSEISGEILPFTKEVNEADILEYLYTYARQINAGNEKFVIRDLSVSLPQESDTGFQKRDINISAIFSSEQTLFNFLEYITQAQGNLRFFVSDFSYPMNETNGSIQGSIPLVLYYNK